MNSLLHMMFCITPCALVKFAERMKAEYESERQFCNYTPEIVLSHTIRKTRALRFGWIRTINYNYCSSDIRC